MNFFKPWNWQFTKWLNQTPHWDGWGWVAIIVVGAYWEIMGALRHDRTTFTDMMRHLTSPWQRAAVLVVLIWHFCIAPANYKP